METRGKMLKRSVRGIGPKPLKKQVNGLVASSIKLFTHKEQALVDTRVKIDSHDDSQLWKHLDRNDTVEQRVVEEIKCENTYSRKRKQRKATKNYKTKVPKHAERKSVENNTNLSINNQYKPYRIPKKRPKHRKELIEENKNHFTKEVSNGDKIPLPPDRFLSDVVTVSTKSQPANTYENSAPNVTQDSCLTPPSQPLNTTDHCYDGDQHINYKFNFLEAIKPCFEALKNRPDSVLEMTCEVCSETLNNYPGQFKKHLTTIHNTKKKKVYIEPDISLEHVRLVARSCPTIVPREPSDIDHCLRLAIENACSIQPTEDLTILSYKCYICLQSWEHYSRFRKHLLFHLVDIDIKTENLMRDTHLFVHVVADAPGKAVENRKMHVQLYSDTDMPVYKCFKCYSYFCDKAAQTYHEMNGATCRGCKIKGDCIVIKKHETNCDQFLESCVPRTCQCGRVLNTEVSVVTHKSMCSLGNLILDFSCTLCNYSTLTKDFMIGHQQNEHAVRSDAYVYQPTVKCDVCDQHYAGPREQHVCTKHEYCPCSVCGQLFENSTVLACHVNAYNESVICKQCPGTLQLEKGCLMTEHEIVHHTSDRMIVHACMYCPEMYSTHLHSKMHLLSHDEKFNMLVYKTKKIYPFKKDIFVNEYKCFYHNGKKTSDIAENCDKTNSFGLSNMVATEAIKKNNWKDSKELILGNSVRGQHDTPNNIGLVNKEIIVEQNTSNMVKGENLNIQDTNVSNFFLMHSVYANEAVIKLEQDDRTNVEEEIIVEQNTSNMVKGENLNIQDTNVSTFFLMHSVDANKAVIKLEQDDRTNVEEEIIVEQNTSNMVKGENLNIQDTNVNNFFLIHSANANKAVIKLEHDDRMNVEDVNLRIQDVFSTNSKERLLEISHDTMNKQYYMKVVDKLVNIEKNTTIHIPLEDQKPDVVIALVDKLVIENTACDNITVQERTKKFDNVITEEIEKPNVSVPSYNIHYEEVYSDFLEELVKNEMECVESQCSDVVENKRTKQDLSERCVKLIRTISDEGVIKEETTDYVNDATQIELNDEFCENYTPNHAKRSEIVLEKLEPHVKFEIDEEFYDDIVVEDVILV